MFWKGQTKVTIIILVIIIAPVKNETLFEKFWVIYVFYILWQKVSTYNMEFGIMFWKGQTKVKIIIPNPVVFWSSPCCPEFS